ncbi:YciI family protein [Cryobacterium sp. PH31-O1]|uniref:YciI family protein n=1 Tax=Cryobacterium sp. PH31-O1 TaxID=3046306 RepID=UPI0024BB305E|nr:YciI family protein [Cryobacterium sp. PH31-O1]MDJ0339635.1 YciI family protein [Cryobacterium sp. PH31-O1]
MTSYVALIYSPDVDWSQPEFADGMAEYQKFGEDAASVIRGGAALYHTPTATTVRVTGGKGGDVVLSDGPYAETKEALTGFYLLECTDLDEAIRVASMIPGAWNGAVEIRPALPMTVKIPTLETADTVTQ